MQSLIEVFRMTEIPVESRLKIIKELGKAINYQYGSNITEPLVYELEQQLTAEQQCTPTVHDNARALTAFQYWLGSNYNDLPTDSTNMTERALRYLSEKIFPKFPDSAKDAASIMDSEIKKIMEKYPTP